MLTLLSDLNVVATNEHLYQGISMYIYQTLPTFLVMRLQVLAVAAPRSLMVAWVTKPTDTVASPLTVKVTSTSLEES